MELIEQILVDSFNFSFETGLLSTSQRLGVISLITKEDKDTKYLKNWRPISLLNNVYKIATKAIAIRLEKVLPSIISSSQTGYVKGRYIGKVSTFAVFLDFEEAFDTIEWNYVLKCLETFNFGPQFRQWISILYKDIMSCVLNNGYATKHFNSSRGVRQGVPYLASYLPLALKS